MSDPVAKAISQAAKAIGSLSDSEDRIAVVQALVRIYDRDSASMLRVASPSAPPPAAAVVEESAEERRRRLDRERKASSRGADKRGQNADSDADTSADIPRNGADNSADMSASVRGHSADSRAHSLSDLSGSGHSLSQQNPRGNVSASTGRDRRDRDRLLLPDRSSVRTGLDADSDADTARAIAEDAQLPDEWRDAVRMLGVRDPDAAWLTFRGHHIAKGTTATERGWRALFVDKWSSRERGYQARDAARGRGREVQRPPETGRTWELPKEAEG